MHLLNHYDVDPKILLNWNHFEITCEFFNHCRTSPVSWVQRSSGAELGSNPKTQPIEPDRADTQYRRTGCAYLPVLMIMWRQKTNKLWSLIHCPVLLPSAWFQKSRWATICGQVPSEVKNVHMFKGQKTSTDYNTLKLQFIFLLVKNIFLLIAAEIHNFLPQCLSGCNFPFDTFQWQV